MAEDQQEETQNEDAEAAGMLADAVKAKSETSEEAPFDEQRAREALTRKNAEAQGLRRRLKELEPLAKRAQELEDASKSEAEKLTERLTVAEQRAVAAETNALRLEVAGEKGLTPTQAKRLIGNTREELEVDADDLLATFAPPPPAAPRPGSRPRESLTPVPVATNGTPTSTDMNEWMRDRSARKST